MKKVVITGDVHHYMKTIIPSLQSEISKFEIVILKRYIDIIKQYSAKATIFVTGKLIKKYPEIFKSFKTSYYVEIAGHGFNLQSDILYKLYYILFKRILKVQVKVPYFFRKLYYEIDSKKMIRVFKEADINPPILYRPHSYIADEALYAILPKYGIWILLNDNPGSFTNKLILKKGLLIIVYQLFKDDPVIKYYPNEELLAQFRQYMLKNLSRLVESQCDIIIQLHPICMKLLDNFNTFKLILSTLHRNGYKFMFLSEYIKQLLC